MLKTEPRVAALRQRVASCAGTREPKGGRRSVFFLRCLFVFLSTATTSIGSESRLRRSSLDVMGVLRAFYLAFRTRTSEVQSNTGDRSCDQTRSFRTLHAPL